MDNGALQKSTKEASTGRGWGSLMLEHNPRRELEMSNLPELLNYFNLRLEQEMHGEGRDITVDKDKLCEFLTEVDLLMRFAKARAREPVAGLAELPARVR